MASNSAPIEKKNRKVLSLETKLEVIKASESGNKTAQICRMFGLPPSTVSTIIGSRKKYKDMAKMIVPGRFKFMRSRDDILVKMENQLISWITDQESNNSTPIPYARIQKKAKEIFYELQSQQPKGTSKITSFNASRGWYEKFKARTKSGYNVVVSLKMKDDEPANSCSSSQHFADIANGYNPKQVFNVDEIGLFWKRMPNNTINKESESVNFNSQKDRLTLLLGGNAFGDFKVKPLLIYHSENPKSLKGFVKAKLPVVWRFNKTASINQSIFADWFCQYFMPSVSNYLRENNLPNKAILVLDDGSSHPNNLEEISEGTIKVIFLPSPTSSLQPMEQNVMTMFKHVYHHIVFSNCLKQVEGSDKPTLNNVWKEYNIKNAVDNIDAAWNQISAYSMNSAWQKLWPECLILENPEEDSIKDIQKKIVELGRQLGFKDLKIVDIQRLIQSQNEELTNEDLRQLDIHRKIIEDEQDESAMMVGKTLSIKDLEEFFKNWESMRTIIQENDPNMERSCKTIRIIESQIQCYREILNGKKKSLMNKFQSETQGKNKANFSDEVTPATPMVVWAQESTDDNYENYENENENENENDCTYEFKPEVSHADDEQEEEAYLDM